MGLINGLDYLINHIEDFKKEKIMRIIQLINKDSKNTFNLLENLLEWSRFQTGRIVCKPKKENLYEIVCENVALLEIIANKKNIYLLNNIEQNTFIYADLNMTRTIIRNLITNAIKYTNSGGRIEITAKERVNFMEISVADTGIGIKNEDIPKLFKTNIKYTQLGTNNEQGTGLGLILCKDLIEKNGGIIEVESIYGKGTNVKFTLPKLSC
ncbi:hypothetical protein GMMP15_380018 [Candidatus Magnetomoraceae bacterium gMMP-15]